MSHSDEATRIQKLYADLPEVELLRLFEQRSDLTDTAQDALRTELRSRRIAPEEIEPEAETPHGEHDDSSIFLWEFRDALQAREAVNVLDKVEIPARLAPGNVRERGDGTSVVCWKLVIAKVDEDSSVKLLRKHCGLFPLPEFPDADDSEPPEEAELITVGAFDDPRDIELAEGALVAASIRFRKTQEPTESGTVWILEVAQAEIENAGNAIEQAFLAASETNAEH